MPVTTTRSERTSHWTKMLRPFALFNRSEPSGHMRSSAGFITTKCGFEFSAHTEDEAGLEISWRRKVIATPGYDFREGQLLDNPSPRHLRLRLRSARTAGLLCSLRESAKKSLCALAR